VVGLTTTYVINAYPLMLRVRISIRARCTTSCDKVCHWLLLLLLLLLWLRKTINVLMFTFWLTTDQWLSSGPLVSSTNKTDHLDITEILLKVALNTIKQTKTIFSLNPFSFLKIFTCSKIKHTWLNNPRISY
jgi:hypothetical protein